MPATVKTPPMMAHVVVRKWYQGLLTSFTKICVTVSGGVGLKVAQGIAYCSVPMQPTCTLLSSQALPAALLAGAIHDGLNSQSALKGRTSTLAASVLSVCWANMRTLLAV
jgi:hypothetical protein